MASLTIKKYIGWQFFVKSLSLYGLQVDLNVFRAALGRIREKPI